MAIKFVDYLYLFGTIICTVYGQLVLKWRIKDYGSLPTSLIEKIKFLISLLLDPFIFSGFVAAFIASLCWMAAMTKLEISYAYPFMGLNFVLVLFFSIYLFGETMSYWKIIGCGLIVLGVCLIGRG